MTAVAETTPDAAAVPPDQETASLTAAAWNSRSRDLAAAGDVRLAVHLQWAADVATLHCLLWESGLADVPDPAAQLDRLSHLVDQAFAHSGQTPNEAAAIVTWARTTLAQAFGSPVDALLADRLAPLDHLERFTTVPTGSPRASGGADTLVRELWEVAGDCSAVGRAMATAGLAQDADDQRRRATLAVFEAYLLARTAGDVLAAELRWELAIARLHHLAWSEFTADDLVVELVAAVEPAAREGLLRELEALR